MSVSRVRGFTRTPSGSVVNTDQTEYNLIKRERARKRETNELRSEIEVLKALVMKLVEEKN